MIKQHRSRIAGLATALLDRALPVTPASRVGALRAANGAYTAWYLGRRVRMFRKVHRTDPALFQPVGPVRVLRKPLPPVVADTIMVATLASTAAFTAGVAHRVTGPLHAALLTWTLSYRNSWSMIFHSDNTLVLATAALGVSPAADAVSVDALLAPRGRPADDWRYATPVRAIQTATVVTYFLAGFAKVAGPLGWGWADGEVLRRQIAADGLRKELLGSKAAATGIRLYNQTGLFRLLAAGSLAVELAAPIVLLDRRLARLWAAGAFGLHWGIFVVMGIRFRYNQSGVVYLPFFPVEKLLPPALR